MEFNVEITVTYKESVLEPQGQAILLACQGHEAWKDQDDIRNIRVGKHIELRVEADSEKQAITRSQELAEKLLHNPVMEKYKIITKKAS